MRRAARVVLVLLVGLLGYGIGVAQPYVLRPPLVVGQDAVTGTASQGVVASLDDVGGRVLSIRPAGDASVLFVLYPGGLVRPQAYEWLGRELASHGVHTVIPEFTFDLAVTDIDRADELIEHYAEGRPIMVGGHSLGGAMAASYAADNDDTVAGLVLMAAYPPENTSLAGAPFSAISLLAEHDAIAEGDDVRGGMARLPRDSELIVIPGAVHSFFGRYGPQNDDGIPTVARFEAEAAIVEALTAYVDDQL